MSQLALGGRGRPLVDAGIFGCPRRLAAGIFTEPRFEIWSGTEPSSAKTVETKPPPPHRTRSANMRLDWSCATITEPMPVPIYDDLVQLARICWRQSHVTQAQDVARELRHMAREYQQQAAKLDGGRLPYFGTSDDERQT